MPDWGSGSEAVTSGKLPRNALIINGLQQQPLVHIKNKFAIWIYMLGLCAQRPENAKSYAGNNLTTVKATPKDLYNS